MGKLRYSEGSVTIEMDDLCERLARRAIEKASPGVLGRIENDSRLVHAHAHALWPVDTGRSKRALLHDVVLGPGSVRGRVSNSVPYAFRIRPKDLYGATTAWAAYVQQPMRRAATKLAKELGPQIRQLLVN